MADSACHDPPVDQVVQDDEGAACDAARRLLADGHERVAYLGSLVMPGEHYYRADAPREWPNSVRRAMGVLRAYRERGLPLSERCLVQIASSEHPRQLMRQWLAAGRQPTAAVCFNWAIASRLADAAAQSGRRAGEELTVIALGEPQAQEATPTPPSAYYTCDWEFLGREVAWLILERIAQPDRPNTRVVVPWSRVAT